MTDKMPDEFTIPRKWVPPVSAAGTVSIAVVVDVEADDIPHRNGSKWKRLVMQQDAALELWHDLGKALGLGFDVAMGGGE